MLEKQPKYPDPAAWARKVKNERQRQVTAVSLCYTPPQCYIIIYMVYSPRVIGKYHSIISLRIFST